MFHCLPLIFVHKSVDMYSSSRIELLYSPSLRISKQLNKSLFRNLLVSKRFSNALTYQSGPPKPISLIRNVILALLNKFLRDTEKQNKGCCSRINFSKVECGEGLCGFFTETVILETLKAADYEKNNWLSHFFLWGNCWRSFVATQNPPQLRDYFGHLWISIISLEGEFLVQDGRSMSLHWYIFNPIQGVARK